MAKNLNPLSRNTKNGYAAYEVVSALQKAIRRSDEESALFWASEMDLSGLAAQCWSRLLTILSEDIGIAEPNLPATIWALYSIWQKKKDHLQLMHAVILMARAGKSHLVNSACGAFYLSERKRYEREIPDHALDRHTRRGQMMGRGIKHFLEVGSVLVPKSRILDRYRTAYEKAWLAHENEQSENEQVAELLLDITEVENGGEQKS